MDKFDAQREAYNAQKEFWEDSHFDTLFDDFIKSHSLQQEWFDFVMQEAMDVNHAEYLQENDSFLKNEFVNEHEDLWNEFVEYQYKEFGSD